MLGSLLTVLVAVAVVLTGLLASPLLDGVERKIRAAIQSRLGPPVTQTWLDLAKLVSKEPRAPPGSVYTVYMVYLTLVLSLASLASLAVASILRGVAGLVLVAFTYTLAQNAAVVMPMATYNPFAFVGASREVMLMLVNEAAMLISLAFLALFTGSADLSALSAVAPSPSYMIVALVVLIASYVASARLPYDLAEAEPELASGILIELGGPYLAMYLLSLYVRRFVAKYLASYVVLAPLLRSPLTLASASIAMVPLLWVGYTVVSQLVGRSRVDIAPLTLFKVYTPLLLVSLILRAVGM